MSNPRENNVRVRDTEAAFFGSQADQASHLRVRSFQGFQLLQDVSDEHVSIYYHPGRNRAYVAFSSTSKETSTPVTETLQAYFEGASKVPKVTYTGIRDGGSLALNEASHTGGKAVVFNPSSFPSSENENAITMEKSVVYTTAPTSTAYHTVTVPKNVVKENSAITGMKWAARLAYQKGDQSEFVKTGLQAVYDMVDTDSKEMAAASWVHFLPASLHGVDRFTASKNAHNFKTAKAEDVQLEEEPNATEELIYHSVKVYEGVLYWKRMKRLYESRTEAGAALRSLLRDPKNVTAAEMKMNAKTFKNVTGVGLSDANLDRVERLRGFLKDAKARGYNVSKREFMNRVVSDALGLSPTADTTQSFKLTPDYREVKPEEENVPSSKISLRKIGTAQLEKDQVTFKNLYGEEAAAERDAWLRSRIEAYAKEHNLEMKSETLLERNLNAVRGKVEAGAAKVGARIGKYTKPVAAAVGRATSTAIEAVEASEVGKSFLSGMSTLKAGGRIIADVGGKILVVGMAVLAAYDLATEVADPTRDLLEKAEDGEDITSPFSGKFQMKDDSFASWLEEIGNLTNPVIWAEGVSTLLTEGGEYLFTGHSTVVESKKHLMDKVKEVEDYKKEVMHQLEPAILKKTQQERLNKLRHNTAFDQIQEDGVAEGTEGRYLTSYDGEVKNYREMDQDVASVFDSNQVTFILPRQTNFYDSQITPVDYGAATYFFMGIVKPRIDAMDTAYVYSVYVWHLFMSGRLPPSTDDMWTHLKRRLGGTLDRTAQFKAAKEKFEEMTKKMQDHSYSVASSYDMSNQFDFLNAEKDYYREAWMASGGQSLFSDLSRNSVEVRFALEVFRLTDVYCQPNRWKSEAVNTKVKVDSSGCLQYHPSFDTEYAANAYKTCTLTTLFPSDSKAAVGTDLGPWKVSRNATDQTVLDRVILEAYRYGQHAYAGNNQSNEKLMIAYAARTLRQRLRRSVKGSTAEHAAEFTRSHLSEYMKKLKTDLKSIIHENVLLQLHPDEDGWFGLTHGEALSKFVTAGEDDLPDPEKALPVNQQIQRDNPQTILVLSADMVQTTMVGKSFHRGGKLVPVPLSQGLTRPLPLRHDKRRRPIKWDNPVSQPSSKQSKTGGGPAAVSRNHPGRIWRGYGAATWTGSLA